MSYPTTLTPLMAMLTLLTTQPLLAQNGDGAAAVFALMDKNEWCPGGSVYLDLQTGSFLLHPRSARPACSEPEAKARVEAGTVGAAQLQVLRSAYLKARGAGLRRGDCETVISNGGPEALVITGPGFSAATPENEGCWSGEAIALHDKLFKVFGNQRQPGD